MSLNQMGDQTVDRIDEWVGGFTGVDFGQWRKGRGRIKLGQRTNEEPTFRLGQRDTKPQDPEAARKRYETARHEAEPLCESVRGAPEVPDRLAALKTGFLEAEAAVDEAAEAENWDGALRLIQRLRNAAEALKDAWIEENKARAEGDRLARQQEQFDRMSGTLDEVERTYFRPGHAKHIAEDLKGGEHFKAFTDALKAFEDARSEDNLGRLQAAAQAYLAHYRDDLGDREKTDKENLRKKQVCETTLLQAKHWRILSDFRGAGEPPWNPVTDTKVQGIYARMVFEENALGVEDKRELLGRPDKDQGVSQSYWIKNTDFGTEDPDRPGQSKRERQLFFKPIDGEQKVIGIPLGGSAFREVAGKALGDALKSMTGIDCGLPETCLTAISNEQLGDREHDGYPDPGKAGTDRVGSMQQFVKSDGTLRGIQENDPTILERVPKEAMHQVALYDLLALNLDRHSGNLLLGNSAPDSPEPPSLLPIDQGLVLPSRAGLDAKGGKMLPPHNALLKLPGAKEKLGPEILEKLDLIDPEAIGRSLRESLELMAQAFPETDPRAMIDEEAIKQAVRAAEFLKKAARTLSVTELFNALAVDTQDIFDSTDEDREAAYERAIKAAGSRGKAIREIEALGIDGMKEMDRELRSLGWGIGRAKATFKMGDFEARVQREPEKLLKLWKGRVENPLVITDMQAKLNELGNPSDLTSKLEGLPAGDAWELVDNAHGYQQDREARQRNRELNADPDGARRRFEELGGEDELARYRESIPDERDGLADLVQVLELWQDYVALGGDRAFYQLGGDSDEGVMSRVKLLRNARLERKGMELQVGEKTDQELFKERVLQDLERAAHALGAIRDNGLRLELQVALRAVQELSDDGRYEEVIPLLGPLEAVLGRAGE